jgi:enoyl-[acyl-carrier protein] reductase II
MNRGLLAALSLGADAVAMGSRLAVTMESPLHQRVKEEVVRRREHETIYSKNIDGLWARVLRTPTAIRAAKRVRLVIAGDHVHRYGLP